MSDKEPKTLKNVYEYWGIPYRRNNSGDDIEQIQLVVTDTGYINYLDNESIFFNEAYPMEEVFNFGEIIIEFSNSLRDSKKIIELFDYIMQKYTNPTLEFAKEYYKTFRTWGYSDLVSRCILNGVLSSLCYKLHFDNFDYKEYFIANVFIDPIEVLSQKHFTPEAFARVSFWEDSNGIMQICYSELGNYTLQTLDAIYARKNHILFHKCRYCNGYFIEKNGNNKKFCPNCKTIHSDLKSDKFRKLYRKAYKTMQQRAKRYELAGNDYLEYTTLYNEPFENDALQKIDFYRKNNDIDGYEQFLEKLKEKYKPHKKGSD